MSFKQLDPKVNIHQQATFHYLQEINAFVRSNVDMQQFPNSKTHRRLARVLKELAKLSPEFSSKQDYTKLYTDYHNALEKVADYELNHKDLRSKESCLDNLFINSFENDNKIHNFIFDNVVNDGDILLTDNVKKNIKNKTEGLSKKDIRHPDNPLNAFFASMLGGFGYNPLKRNNVPYLPFASDRLPTSRTCLRIGAQTRDSGYVNSTFQRYLLANARTRAAITPENPQGQYDYVYISLMKTEESRQDVQKSGMAKKIDQFVRNSEGTRAAAIECINLAKDFRAAAITLPADGGFFLGDFSLSKGKALNNAKTNMADLSKQLISSIQLDRNDFSMSKDVKKRLFGEPFNGSIIEQLLKEAIVDVVPGSNGKNLNEINLAPAERNAVLFQFVKWNLSNFILDTLNPRAYNMSCKDAIDRGGIHTLWYHMNLLAKNGTPMTKEEFFTYLDTPAMIVKYRALNANRNLLLNVMQQRLATDSTFAKQHPWAADWVAANSPKVNTVTAEEKVELAKLENILTLTAKPAVKTQVISEQDLKVALTNVFNQQKQTCAAQARKTFSYADSGHINVPVMIRC